MTKDKGLGPKIMKYNIYKNIFRPLDLKIFNSFHFGFLRCGTCSLNLVANGLINDVFEPLRFSSNVGKEVHDGLGQIHMQTRRKRRKKEKRINII